MSIPISIGFATDPHLFLGVSTDTAFFGGNSTLEDSTDNTGTKINNITLSKSASSRELGVGFLIGYQFIEMLDVSIRLGGHSTLTSQAIGSQRLIYLQKNALSFEINTKGTSYIHKNIGIYAQAGIGLSYIYLTSAGGSEDIDLGLQWNDIGGYVLIGLGSSLRIGETNNHRFSLGLQNKFIFQDNKQYSIKTNNGGKIFTFGETHFLLGLHFEYTYFL